MESTWLMIAGGVVQALITFWLGMTAWSLKQLHRSMSETLSSHGERILRLEDGRALRSDLVRLADDVTGKEDFIRHVGTVSHQLEKLLKEIQDMKAVRATAADIGAAIVGAMQQVNSHDS